MWVKRWEGVTLGCWLVTSCIVIWVLVFSWRRCELYIYVCFSLCVLYANKRLRTTSASTTTIITTKTLQSQMIQQVNSTNKRKGQELRIRDLQVHSPSIRLDWTPGWQCLQITKIYRDKTGKSRMSSFLPIDYFFLSCFFKLQFILQLFLSTLGHGRFPTLSSLPCTHCNMVTESLASLFATGRKQEPKCFGILARKLRQILPLYPVQCCLSL